MAGDVLARRGPRLRAAGDGGRVRHGAARRRRRSRRERTPRGGRRPVAGRPAGRARPGSGHGPPRRRWPLRRSREGCGVPRPLPSPCRRSPEATLVLTGLRTASGPVLPARRRDAPHRQPARPPGVLLLALPMGPDPTGVPERLVAALFGPGCSALAAAPATFHVEHPSSTVERHGFARIRPGSPSGWWHHNESRLRRPGPGPFHGEHPSSTRSSRAWPSPDRVPERLAAPNAQARGPATFHVEHPHRAPRNGTDSPRTRPGGPRAAGGTTTRTGCAGPAPARSTGNTYRPRGAAGPGPAETGSRSGSPHPMRRAPGHVPRGTPIVHGGAARPHPDPMAVVRRTSRIPAGHGGA